jgi:hypothetical protein
MPDVEAFSREWSRRIAADPLAARVIEALWENREQFASPVLQKSRETNPVIDAVAATDYEATRAHVVEHFRALLALPAPRVRELGEDPMAFVRRHGVRRAQGGVPLQAVLQGYRSGHKSFWSAIGEFIRQLAPNPEAALDAAMVLSDYTIDYTDLISRVVTDAYLEEEAKLAEERTRLGLAVMEHLLAGEAPGQEEGWALIRRLGLADGRPMTVAVARAETSAKGAADGAMASRALSLLARGLEAALPLERFGRIVGVRGEAAVAIVAAAERPGAQAAAALRAAEGLLTAEAGPFRVGLGLDCAGIADLPRSLEQARAALSLQPEAQAVVSLAEASVDDYLRRTADETARRLAPPLPAAIRDGELGRTLEAFAAANLNVKAVRPGAGRAQQHRLPPAEPGAPADRAGSALVRRPERAGDRAGAGGPVVRRPLSAAGAVNQPRRSQRSQRDRGGAALSASSAISAVVSWASPGKGQTPPLRRTRRLTSFRMWSCSPLRDLTTATVIGPTLGPAAS